MPAVLKKNQSSLAPSKRKSASKDVAVVSEVDVLIARLKKIRKGQVGQLDIRQAIADGRR
ncbi:hypothetical protein MASR1M60_10110 [Rhodocyclaceae bacterium]